MRLIRQFEELVVQLVNSNEIAGVTHEYIGQEAVAVGMCQALAERDVLTSTHRGHGHLLARGAAPEGMLAELLGRETGLNRGHGGSMHIADVSLGIYGANGMVGGGVPFALGAASVQDDDEVRVAVAFFGDGALNQGVLLESMNLAAAWKLPVVFCCENNGYAVTTKSSDSMRVSPRERAEGFGLTALEVDGMDVAAVAEAAAWAVERARRGEGPTFLDCRCYRFVGHHTAERTMNLTYRTQDEIDTWRDRDPLDVAARLLVTDGVSVDVISQMDDDVRGELSRALEEARQGRQADGESALRFMYASPIPTRWGTE
jgi:TPP-dependent pyruvate/acetoin dehydrogenase alpha subunit